MKTTEIVITIKVPEKDGEIDLRQEIGSAMCNNSVSEDFKNNNIFCNYTHIPGKIIYDADFTQCSDSGRITAKRAIDNAVREAFNTTYESEVLSSESLEKLIYSIGEDNYINLHTFMTSTEVPLEKRNEVLKYIRNALGNDNIETDEQENEIGPKSVDRVDISMRSILKEDKKSNEH